MATMVRDANAAADLVIYWNSSNPGYVFPTNAATNTALRYAAVIRNNGDTTTGTFPYFFQTATAANGGGTVTNLASSTTSALAALTNVLVTSPLITFSTNGTYSVRVCADMTSPSGGGSVTENSESNNCSTWTNVNVAATTASLNVNVNPASGGTLSASPQGTYSSWPCTRTCTSTHPTGTLVTVTANPIAGYSFGGWSSKPGYNPPGGTIQCLNYWNSVTTRTCTVPLSASGSVYSHFDTMNGTLTGSGCTISAGLSSCSTDLSWSINYPEASPTAITATGMSNINVTTSTTTPQSGTQTATVPYPSRTFYLYNNGKSLVPTAESPDGSGVTITASCAAGTNWNGAICVTSSALRGKTLKDDNGNGAYDVGELYIRDTTNPGCTNPSHPYTTSINYSGTSNGSTSLNQCSSSSGDPIYNAPVPPGSYTITAVVPAGWEYTGTGANTQSQNVTAPSGGGALAFFFMRPILYQPDLTAGAVTPTNAVSGVSQTYSATLSNIGNAGTGSSFPYFFQWATGAGGSGTITDLSSSTMAALSQGGSGTATSPLLSFPSAGTYSVRACADKTNSASTGSITESNENNNCGAWTDVVVSTAPGGLRGKVLKDDDGDGVADASEVYIKDPSNTDPTCTSSFYSYPITIGYTGPMSGSVTLMQCGSPPTYHPIYAVNGLTPGTYTLTIAVPPGWQYTGSPAEPQSRTVNVPSGGVSVDIFYIRQIPTTVDISLLKEDGSPFPNPASPSVFQGESARVVWSSSNAAACTGTNFNAGTPGTSGNLLIDPPPPIGTTTYTITCNGVSDSITLVVKKKPGFLEN